MKQTARHASDTLKEALNIAHDLAGRGVPSEVLQEAVSIAAGIAGDAGVPGLSSGLEALLTVLEKIQVSESHLMPEVRGLILYC